MIENLSFEDFKKFIYKVNDTIQKEKIFLSELDSVIGDGDHGVTMSKGTASGITKIEETDPKSISGLLKTFGNAISVTIGGVGGPIFGSVFSEMGRNIDENKEYADIKDLYSMFSSSLNKVMTLGRGAKPGDKTMVDAFYPAVKSLEKSADEGQNIKAALAEMVSEAKKGAESTKDMVSSRGKSSYCGERSIGYEDAGANTMYFIFKSFYDAI